VLGVVGSVFAARYAVQVVHDAASDDTKYVLSNPSSVLTSRTRRTIWFLSITFGAVTGGLVSGRDWLVAAALVVTAILTIVQTPIDLALHRLTRPTTLAALVVLVAVLCARVATTNVSPAAPMVIAAASVTAAFAILHVVSPRSLGWGDVLIVAPLSLAVAAASTSRVIPWLLLACCTAGAHGLLVRVRRGERFVPFGPHLLVAAWLAQAVAV
jgi:prepilin signal peptidase PulO-like enzyme (type II secretory pathway)